MDVVSGKKCTQCGFIKPEHSFPHKGGQYSDRARVCKMCTHDRRSTQTKKPPKLLTTAFIKKRWKKDYAWHVAREKHLKIMRRDVPYYPSNEESL